jgi:hypothetical protein
VSWSTGTETERDVQSMKMSASCLSAVVWLSVVGAKGEPGDGCCRALMRSCAAARTRSKEDAVGI